MILSAEITRPLRPPLTVDEAVYKAFMFITPIKLCTTQLFTIHLNTKKLSRQKTSLTFYELPYSLK